jgi:hypothetical protein
MSSKVTGTYDEYRSFFYNNFLGQSYMFTKLYYGRKIQKNGGQVLNYQKLTRKIGKREPRSQAISFMVPQH